MSSGFPYFLQFKSEFGNLPSLGKYQMAFLPYPSPSPSPAVRRYAGLEAPSAPSTQQPGPAFLMTLSPQTGPFTRPSAFLKGICCSVAQSCPTLCDPMGCSNPGFPVSWSPGACSNSCPLRHDAVQTSLSPTSPPAFNFPQGQGTSLQYSCLEDSMNKGV